MISRKLQWVVGLLAMMTVACNADDLMHRIATPQRDARAQHVLRMFIAGERDSLLAHARIEGDSATFAKRFAQLDSMLRGRRVDSLTLVGANLFTMSGRERLTLSYEFRTERGWLFASITTLDSASVWSVPGVHVEPIARDLRAMYEFRLANASAAQYLALLAMAACAIFTVGTAIFLATRTKYPKRWRWVLASLVCVSTVFVNWTTGEVSSQLVIVQLIGAGVARASEFAPWIVSFSFPIGAIVALGRYRSYMGALTTAATPAGVEQPSSHEVEQPSSHQAAT